MADSTLKPLAEELGISISVVLRAINIKSVVNEYTGDDYEADMVRMDESDVMKCRWTFSKPCFLYHDKGHYYDDLQEIFYNHLKNGRRRFFVRCLCFACCKA